MIREAERLVYRIKYLFKGTRDKGHEIADCYGTFNSYEVVQTGNASPPFL